MAGVLVTNYNAAVALANNTAKTQAVTVPAGKRWFLFGGIMSNADNVERATQIYITDGTNTVMYIRQATAQAAGAIIAYPNTVALATNWQFPVPMPLSAGWTITFYWAAGGASAGGNATISAVVSQMDA